MLEFVCKLKVVEASCLGELVDSRTVLAVDRLSPQY